MAKGNMRRTASKAVGWAAKKARQTIAVPKRLIQNRGIRKTTFADPIKFNADGKNVAILRHGFMPQQKPQIIGRAVVLVIVDGKLLQFYKSSGASSKRNTGDWLPFVEIIGHNAGEVLGKKPRIIQKFETHPNFPGWVLEIGERIKLAERNSELNLHANWSEEVYSMLRKMIRKRHPSLTAEEMK